MKKKGPTPEEFAQWAEERRPLQEKADRWMERWKAWEEREERRRRRLRRLTFGLLGR